MKPYPSRLVARCLSLLLPLALLSPSLGIAGSPGEPQRAISIEECVEASLRNNIDLSVSRAERDIAQLDVPIERAAFIPRFTGELSTFRSVLAADTSTTGALLVNDQKVQKFNLSATDLLPIGMTVTGSFENQRQDESAAFARLAPQYSTALSLSAKYPLLKNRGYEVTTAPLFIAYVGSAAKSKDWEAKAMDTAAASRTAFLAFYAASKEIDVRKSAVTLAEHLLRQIEARVEGGAAAPSDRLPAEAAAAARAEELLRSEEAARNAEYELKNLLGVRSPAEWRESLVPVPLSEEIPPPGADETFEEAIKRRPEAAAQEHRKTQTELQEKIARSRTRPSLELTASAGLSGIAGTPAQNSPFGNSASAFQGDYGDSLNQTFSGRYYNWFVGLKTEIPWNNDREKAEWERAKIAREEQRLQGENVTSRVWMEVQKGRGDLNATLARIKASKISVLAGEKKLTAEENKLAIGRTTIAQVLQFQQDLSEARLAELRALTDGYAAQTRLWRATGTILDKLGVVLR
jgi:outer membrane protein TolC